MQTTTAFISYSWDDEEHKDWVKSLANKLRQNGIMSILDQWHVIPGDPLPDFMENAIKTNDYVLIICTPNYKQKSDARTGGVGYEGNIITGEVFATGNHRKFIPILARGCWQDSAPTWLKGKCYIDLSDGNFTTASFYKLISTLRRENEVPPPVSNIRVPMAERKIIYDKVEERQSKEVKLPVIASSEVDWEKRATVVTIAIGIASLLFNAGSFWTSIKDREKESENQRRKSEEQIRLRQQMILNLIFGESSKQFYTPSFDNPYAAIGGMTEPTKDALSSVLHHLGGVSNNMEELKFSGPTNIDGSLLLLGGPVPNPVSRSILGVGGESPIFKKALNKHVCLPISFSNIESVETGPGKRPDYQILVRGKSLSVSKGSEDYLVITSIPNIYSSKYVFGHRLLNIAGLHGGGTRAIDLVLRDEWLEKLYKRVNESNELKDAAAWQAIVRVELDSNNRNFPKRILDLQTFKIELDKDDFAKTNEHVLLNGIPLEIIHC